MFKLVLRALCSPLWWQHFILCGVFFLLFGVSSYNLIFLLKANLTLFLENGWVVVEDGGLRQLLELLGLGYLSILFWVLFKYCETQLVKILADGPSPTRRP